MGKPLEPPLAPRYVARRGEYRVIYYIAADVVEVRVVTFAHRRDAYRRRYRLLRISVIVGAMLRRSIALFSLLLLAGCAATPAPRPTAFQRPATAADEVPGMTYPDSRVVGSWQGSRLYLAIPEGGALVCLVVVEEGGTGTACADRPPIVLGSGGAEFLFDTDDPGTGQRWQLVADDVYAR